MKKVITWDDVLSFIGKLAVVILIFLLGIFCGTCIFSCQTPQNITNDETTDFYYDQIVTIDYDRNMMLYYFEDPYEISLEDIMTEDLSDSTFIIQNNKLEYSENSPFEEK